MQQILIDTDILIDYLRGDEKIGILMDELWRKNLTCVSTLSIYELYAGMRKGEEIYIANLMMPMKTFDVTPEIAEFAGQRRAKYRGKGITLGDIDCMIAATAILNKCKLLTKNVKHYPSVELFNC